MDNTIRTIPFGQPCAPPQNESGRNSEVRPLYGNPPSGGYKQENEKEQKRKLAGGCDTGGRHAVKIPFCEQSCIFTRVKLSSTRRCASYYKQSSFSSDGTGPQCGT